jgi:hypothetical protein
MKPADDADLPTAFMNFADAETAFITVADMRTAGHEKFADRDAGDYMPSLQRGGTILLSQPVTHDDPSRMIR